MTEPYHKISIGHKISIDSVIKFCLSSSSQQERSNRKGFLIGDEPKIINKNGEVVYLIDGWSVDNPEKIEVVKFGIMQADLIKRNDRGQISALAQFDGIVAPGLIMARHIFCGLNRPLYAHESMEGDSQKLVHTWRPRRDFDWPDPKSGPRRLDPPKDRVFVVIVNKNVRHLRKWPEVYGWIDRWNWVDEDPKLAEAPLNWSSRYDKRLFTRKE